eukprot:EC722044.1.p1 GENE.EC722044.1~~EC722044.1.p1  ORF type:complete len:153 (+),score=12.64 EC722044.1:71-529(+)
MSRPYRQSIMMRPVKSPSLKNEENYDREFQAEQQRLAQLSARKQQLEQERLNSLYPTYGTKADTSAKLREEMERQLEAKEEAKRREREQEVQIARALEDQGRLTRHVESSDEQARREYQRYLMEENKKVCCSSFIFFSLFLFVFSIFPFHMP